MHLPPAIKGSKAGRIPCWVQTWQAVTQTIGSYSPVDGKCLSTRGCRNGGMNSEKLGQIPRPANIFREEIVVLDLEAPAALLRREFLEHTAVINALFKLNVQTKGLLVKGG